PDAAASEVVRARPVVAGLARETLVLGDRLYATAAFFELLRTHGCWGVVRRQRTLGLHKLERRRKRRFLGGDLEEWPGRARSGSPRATPRRSSRSPRKNSRPRNSSRKSRWRASSTCMPNNGSGSGDGSIRVVIRTSSSTGARIAGLAPRDGLCRSSIVPMSD